jgi:hypothetical protein
MVISLMYHPAAGSDRAIMQQQEMQDHCTSLAIFRHLSMLSLRRTVLLMLLLSAGSLAVICSCLLLRLR